MKINTRIISTGLIAIMVLFLIPAISFSADVVFTSLQPITTGLRLPKDVAVSPDGDIYVVDGYKNQVLIYDRRTQPAGNIPIPKPTSVAISSTGNIYIGTNSDLSVKILDTSHNIIGSLGKGAGEFKLPMNITVDNSTGNVYVVDQLDHSIKVYTSGGSPISNLTINDYPNLPEDLTIMKNKIYVLDHPLIPDQFGGTIRGARVRIFTMDGSPDGGFGSYGTQKGQFIRPVGITSDTDGILYITDSFHGVVMCFDTNANNSYIGAIQNPSKPMVTPMGIALGEDRRLFVASLNTSSVHIFGLEGYTGIAVYPYNLSFTAQQGQANPPSQILTITNSGSETLTYTASTAEGWIVLNTPSVTVSPQNSGTIPAGVNIAGLGINTYNGQITITASSGATEVIKVKLEITAPVVPTALTVTPNTLTYTYRVGDPLPLSQTLTIGLSGGAATTCTATSDSEWLSISPSTMSGNSTTFALVNVHPSDLDPGLYKGKITINAPGAEGSPAYVEVTLTVISGTIKVTCNTSDASFKIEGPTNYEGTGESWTKTGVPDGTYKITYNPVTGYKTPPSETKELTEDGTTIEFEGKYISLAMTANIVASWGADYKSPSATGIFDANGTMLFSFSPFSEGQNNTGANAGLGGKLLSRLRYIDNIPVNTAVGDIDGDGQADIVVGLGANSRNPARIAAYRADGTLIGGSDFIALSTLYGANVTAADFDGDGKAEIVAGTGTGSRNPAQVKIFSYDSGTIIETGINFKAFELKGGVNVAAGDVDGDDVPELITAAGARSSNSPEVRVWKIDTSGGQGHWSIIDTGVHFVAFSGKYGANVTTGDLNGDGINEIIVSSGPDSRGGHNIIKAFNGDGTDFGLDINDSSVAYGLSVASADLDNDGVSEIVAGLGPKRNNPATVKAYKSNGTLTGTFDAFNDKRFGVVVSAGDLGY
jgi:hypothetical protein